MTERHPPTDEIILTQYKKDRREGFRLLYQKYSERILSVCRRYSADDGQAMDYFQDVMLRVNDRLRSYRFKGEGSLLLWLSRVTVNMIVDKMREESRIEILDINEVGGDLEDTSYEDSDKVPVDEMFKMIDRLSPVKREVFNLHCIDGYSHKEVGTMLGITEDGASSLLSKARKDLSEMIKEYLNKNQC